MSDPRGWIVAGRAPGHGAWRVQAEPMTRQDAADYAEQLEARGFLDVLQLHLPTLRDERDATVRSAPFLDPSPLAGIPRQGRTQQFSTGPGPRRTP